MLIKWAYLSGGSWCVAMSLCEVTSQIYTTSCPPSKTPYFWPSPSRLVIIDGLPDENEERNSYCCICNINWSNMYISKIYCSTTHLQTRSSDLCELFQPQMSTENSRTLLWQKPGFSADTSTSDPKKWWVWQMLRSTFKWSSHFMWQQKEDVECRYEEFY